MSGRKPMPVGSRVAYVIAAAVGAAAWLAISLATDRREAWDSDEYFSIGVPALAAASALLGYVAPQGHSTYAIAIGVAQLAVMIVRGGVPSLVPMTVAMLAVLALPNFAAAYFAAIVRGRRSGS